MSVHGAHFFRHACRLPCMFPGICPCSPCDRASPRYSDSTLGSMTALLSRWWARAAPPARQRNTTDSQKRRPNVRNKSSAWLRLPFFFLLVLHKLCKFIRGVFAVTMMLVFKPECANCQELGTSPSSARAPCRSICEVQTAPRCFVYAALTPRWPISARIGALASRVCPIRNEPENQRLSCTGKRRQTKLIEHYETRRAVNGSTGRYVVI